jgi:hypothetical protein
LEKEDEDDNKQITNKYDIDLIAQYKDTTDDLVMHWGMARKNLFEWTEPE